MQKIREYVIKWKCPDEHVIKLTNIFFKHTKQIPVRNKGTDRDGKDTFGFCPDYLSLAKWEAELIPFLEILEIDQEMGLTDAIHITNMVFLVKAIKIIKDKKVRYKNYKKCFHKLLELANMVEISKAFVEGFSKCSSDKHIYW